MFCKIAFRNIRRSFKDYAIYFFTLVLGVAIFYVFNALETQSVMLGLSEYMNEIVKLMNGILSGVSVFVALVLGFLIIYASRFLIKRRSQEFGTYMVLGMSKRKISVIILLETVMIGIVSLAVGLVIGVVLSQFTSAIVANMFEADMTDYRFVFSSEACIKTLIYFAIIFLVVMLLDTVMVAKQRLIKLLQARRMTETVKVRKTWVAVIVLVAGIAMLAWAYSMVTVNVSKLSDENILIVLSAGALGTALFFWSIATIIIKLVQKTSFYSRGLNTFTLRQFSSAINTSAVAMTVICLMLFVTICVSVSAISLREVMVADIDKTTPIDIEYIATVNDDVRTEDYLKERYSLDLNDLIAEKADYSVLYSDELTFGTSFQSIWQESNITNAFDYDSSIPMMRVSDYNRISDLLGNEKVKLDNNQYVIVANFQPMVEFYQKALARNTDLEIGDTVLAPASAQVMDGMYQMSSTANTNTGIIIIPDNISLPDTMEYQYTIGNFHDGVDANELIDQLQKIQDQELQEQHYIAIELKQMILNSNIGMNAIVTFVALYLGIIFLIASAALLALKQLTESSDNRMKYAVLQKLGASDKMINHALCVQIGAFFVLPLLVAIIHSICGLIFCNYTLEFFGGIQIGQAVIGTGAIFLIVYGGYFLITYLTSKRVIRGEI